MNCCSREGGKGCIIEQGVSEGVELDLPASAATLNATHPFYLAASSHVSSYIHPFCVTASGMSHLQPNLALILKTLVTLMTYSR